MRRRRLHDADEYSDWLNTKWRPMVGWVYMAVCIADFIVFPSHDILGISSGLYLPVDNKN